MERQPTLKEQLAATWSAGDYGIIALSMADSAEEFLARHRPGSGVRMLDVACGSGQLAIPAARAGAEVVGIDISEPWIQQARKRAADGGLDARFDVGDVENMPYDDNRFDLVISLIGAMFAPDPEKAASEMLRVCRPGGRIVMGNWTPEGFVGDFFRTVARHAPPPEMPSPLLWGTEESVRERLDDGVSDLVVTRRMIRFRYTMPPAMVAEHYLEYFGPTRRAVEGLDAEGREGLRADLEALWAGVNDGAPGTTEADGEILEVVAVKA